LAAAARERNATAKSGPVFRRRVTLVARLVDRAAGMALDTLMGVPRRARRLFVTVGVLVSLVGLALAACTVKAPPAPQSTDTPRNSAPPPQRITQIIMGIDSIGAGFNPHLLSDLSPVNAAISALVLPSAFRPVPDPDTPTGSRWEMDPTLLVAADVTNQNPFTVTYKIRPEAQWTDNAPIGADDFWYLWRQMVSQPGVVDPAGYDLITGVQSIEGGKQAVVTFAQPYPAWQELFSAARHWWPVPGREHRPAARRNPDRAQ
jgi:ABC-type transport system substrate-binding protein